MDEHDLANFCRDWLATWSNGSPEQLRTFYTENAYYSDPGRPQGLHGQELLPYFQKLLAKYPGWNWRPVEILPIAKGFCLKWRAEFLIGKQNLEVSGLDIVELENGKISRNEVYFDRSILLRH
jgi:hypothetical protein